MVPNCAQFNFFLVFICWWLSHVNGSKSCEIFLNAQSDLRNLKGVWYRTLESNSTLINSCVHFEIIAPQRRTTKINVIDMKTNMNITLTGTLKPGGKLEISTKVFTLVTYNIAVIGTNYFCVYDCGDRNKDDYVQCATKTSSVSDNLMKVILNKLQGIGMQVKTFQRTPKCTTQ